MKFVHSLFWSIDNNVHAHFRWNLVCFLTAECWNWSGLLLSVSVTYSFLAVSILDFYISDCFRSTSIHKCRYNKKGNLKLQFYHQYSDNTRQKRKVVHSNQYEWKSMIFFVFDLIGIWKISFSWANLSGFPFKEVSTIHGLCSCQGSDSRWWVCDIGVCQY